MHGSVAEHIEIVEGAGGPKARIKGSRIRVEDVMVWHEKLRWPPKKIVREFPQLTLTDVYAALAYYWEHHDEIEHKMAEDHAFVEEMRRQDPGPLEEKLRQLPGETLKEKLRHLRGE